jgi:hypothetical protein
LSTAGSTTIVESLAFVCFVSLVPHAHNEHTASATGATRNFDRALNRSARPGGPPASYQICTR